MFDLIVALIPGLPLLAAFANGLNALLGDRYSERVIRRLAAGSILFAFLGSLWVLVALAIDPAPREVVVYRWLVSGDLNVNIAFLIDPLSAIMMLVTTSTSFLIALFSINYMHNERGFSRFFTVLPLFVFAMLVLVMANNYVLLFLGWEGVGVCSYLLIGFYYDRRAATQAGTTAFIMNRVGDAGFLLGIFLIITHFGTADYMPVFAGAETLDVGTATAIGLCLLLGATGKSAQLPLAPWMIRAMAGPTPSSALFYGATMVTAGVYLVARSHPIYAQAPNALLAVALIGAATALFGALVSLVQTDIKSLLAYSTTAQLGLMFLACGLGAYSVAIFHLTAHAVFKTLMFLTAPSILHQLHGGADVRQVGPAKETIPVASRLFLVGAVGLLVFPFLSGWWQGDILAGAVGSDLPILIAAGVVAAFTAAFATGRMVQVAFDEDAHGGDAVGHQRSPWMLTKPLLILAASVVIGIALGLLPGGVEGTWFRAFLRPVVPMEPGVPAGSLLLTLAILAVMILLLVAGWFTPLYFDRFRPEQPGLLLFKLRRLYNLAANRFWLDEFYDRAAVQPAIRLGRLLERLDTGIIDRAAGVPAAPSRVDTAARTWEEQRLASQVVGAVGPAGERTAAASTWEETGEATGVLGWLTRVSGDTTGWVEREGIGQVTGAVGRLTKFSGDAAGWVEREGIGQVTGAVGRLTKFSGDAAGWVEREGIGRVSGAFGWSTRVSGDIAGWVERGIIGRAERFLVWLNETIAGLSSQTERHVFHTGVHVGVPRITHGLGRILNRTEETLGRPLVIGSILLIAVLSVMVGTL